MRRIEWLPLLVTAALTACGGAPLPSPDDADVPPGGAVAAREVPASRLTAEDLPASLTCVSEASWDEGAVFPRVWRLQAVLEGGTATVDVSRGAQFLNHGGERSDDDPDLASTRAVAASVSASGRLELVEEGPFGLRVSLERRGAFLFGEMADEQCYLRHEAALTCWDPQEVFGWSLSGERALVARFEWGTGRCVDDDGDDARNSLPIEFVRETGFGECADLSGAALNGDDYAYPDLYGWYLPGVRLDGASLFFARLEDATLHGADLGGLEYGYAEITGTADATTVLPEEGCLLDENAWGASLQCAR